MKKIYPYILPSIALLIVFFLTIRWYSQRTERDGEITEASDTLEIENLTEEEMNSVVKGTGDFATVKLTGEGEAAGEVRYEIKEDKVLFTLNADLPDPEALRQDKAFYQVWIKSGAENAKKAFQLSYGKSGYFGSASLNKSNLPFTILLSKETQDDATMEELLLSGDVVDQTVVN